MTVKSRILMSVAAFVLGGAAPALAQTEIQWWHAMTGANNDVVVRLAEEFNARRRTSRSFRPIRAPMPTR